MSRFLDYRWWLLCLVLVGGGRSASGFALLGPGESWQTPVLGYVIVTQTPIPDGFPWTIFSTDFSAHPMNLGEEFRWNVPVLYYSYDATFLDYFGSNGVAAVDAAVAILNNLNNVSTYSSALTEFPLQEARVNNTAAAMHLFDLKSAALELLVERLGLADPQRWAWTIRARSVALPQCPFYDYGIIQRNFDPVSLAPTRYVNGSFFTYFIRQQCPPAVDFADAEEFAVDPTATYFSAVASPRISIPRTTYYGYFHTSLTRDDVGGLRYLYQTNNVNWESMSSDSVLLYTNVAGGQQLLITTNLTLLAWQAQTNDPVALQTLYPTLQIVSSTNIYTNVWVTNFTSYFTNYPLDPFGTPPHLVIVTNRTLTVQTYYRYVFGNVVTFAFTNGAWRAIPLPDINTHVGKEWLTLQTTYLTNSPYDPYGTPPRTNTSSFTYSINTTAGDYFILPTNLCGIAVAGLQAALLSTATNVVSSVTNLPTGSSNAQSFTQVIINYETNHAFTYYPVNCVLTNNTTLVQGIEKVSFVRRDFDSLLGRFLAPITNYYTHTVVTNSALSKQQLFRVVTQPDILFSAADLASSYPYLPTTARSNPNFNTNGVLANASGPGVIESPTVIQFNKVGPIYVNGTYPLYIDELSALLDFAWASFDGTTNAPVLYPNGASIYNLENQVLIQISPTYLPAGSVGKAYSATLSTVGATPNWTAPYTWDLASGSPPLPPGLNLSVSGTITGTPTVAGFYDFMVRATDSAGRTAQRSYSINLTDLP